MISNLLNNENASSRLGRAGSALLVMVWFGLVAGALELGVVSALGTFRPRVPVTLLRTNRHQIWMIPAADVAVFAMVGVVLAVIAATRLFPNVVRWVTTRLPIGLCVLTVLLGVEGLHPAASVLLACGVAVTLGLVLDRRFDSFVRFARISAPLMLVAFAAFAGISYQRIVSNEQRMLARSPKAKQGAPNVLFIVLDTVRATCLSLNGHYRPTTPNLERLAQRGMIFTEARATAPWTAPSHASMMTGRQAHELSIAPSIPLDGTHPTLAEVLAEQGYATAGFVGNIYYCNALYGFDRGFGRFEDSYENRTASAYEALWSTGIGRRIVYAAGHPMTLDDGETLLRKNASMLNRDVISWLDEKPADRPFFAFINYYDAHRPYHYTGDDDLRFGRAALPFEEQRAIERRYEDLLAGKPLPEGFTGEQITIDALELFHDAYDSCIAHLDRQVGRLIDEFERRGQLDNTLIVITSDHGELLGEHGMVAHGATVYRQESHVPLLIVPPRGGAPQLITEPASLRDIPATVADYVGLGDRSPFPGRTLSRFFLGGTASNDPEFVLCELQHYVAFPEDAQIPFRFGPSASLVARDRVYIRGYDGGEELYDLRNDLLEIVDLARVPEFRNEVERFRDEMGKLRPELPRPTGTPEAKNVWSQSAGVKAITSDRH